MRRPLLAALLLTSCAHRAPALTSTAACAAPLEPGAVRSCPLPDTIDRGYDLLLPDDWSADRPTPLLVVLHGGGGNRRTLPRLACPDGDVDDPGCLHHAATARGWAVVLPDGTGGRLAPDLRTWNAGGGTGDWRCTSGRACEEGVDDVAAFDALLDDLAARMTLDPRRVYVTGISNGGAMSHRLACERADRVAAIAPVGGALQLTTSAACAPSEPVAVLHVHGTADPAWRYAGGVPETRITGQAGKRHVSVDRTMREWAAALGCAGSSAAPLPDRTADGTTTLRHTWAGCSAALEHLEVRGGGHTWPDGQTYLPPGVIGPVWTDWGNALLLDFLEDHPKPR